MTQKYLLAVAIILIFQTKLQASELQSKTYLRRVNLNSSLKLTDINYDKISDEEETIEVQILNALKAREIGFDQKTTINIHNEDDRVDFSCFDCIVRELSPNDQNTYSAWNGRKLGF